MFKALDIFRFGNLLFARIISLIFDMISSVVEVDRRPELFVYSRFSIAIKTFKSLVCRLSTHSSISINPDKQNFMFVLCSTSLLSMSYDKDAKHIFTALSVTTDMVNGASWNLLDEPTGVAGTRRARWLHVSSATYNQARSFTTFSDHTSYGCEHHGSRMGSSWKGKRYPTPALYKTAFARAPLYTPIPRS
jgi:hypothetical protein